MLEQAVFDARRDPLKTLVLEGVSVNSWTFYLGYHIAKDGQMKMKVACNGLPTLKQPMLRGLQECSLVMIAFVGVFSEASGTKAAKDQYTMVVLE